MSCDGTLINKMGCIDWAEAQRRALELEFKANSTTAQLNIERQIGYFNGGKPAMMCIKEHTGLAVFAQDEFCGVVKGFQANNFITDKKTNAEIDKFCK